MFDQLMYANLPVKEPSEKAVSDAGSEKISKIDSLPFSHKAEELEKLRKRRLKMAKTAKGGELNAFNFFFGKEKAKNKDGD